MSLRYLLIILPVFLTHTSFKSSPVRMGKDFALFFAVSNYTNWEKLKNPVSEAESIAKELRDHYGFATEVVKDPTKADIQSKIEEYRRRSYADDGQLMIFFTGHGEYLEATREGFFIPKDARRDDASQDSYLPYLRLQRWIETLPCRHILLAIDACFSGTFNDDIALKGGPGQRPGQSDWRQQFIENSLQYRSRIFMASGAKVRTPDQSAFAAQFLSALRSFGGDDRLINITELWSFVQRAKPNPCCVQFGGNETGHEPGGDFLFVLEEAADPAAPMIDADQATWNSTQKQNTPEAYAYYLEVFPKGRYNVQAFDERAWLLAIRQNTDAAYQIYLDTNPKGLHCNEARIKTGLPLITEAVKSLPSTAVEQDNHMILIEGGYFQMGNEEGDKDEKPIRNVTVNKFYLSKYELTVGEFRQFIEEAHYLTDAEKDGSSRAYVDNVWQIVAGRNWRHDAFGNFAMDNQPVINVSWNDAVAYCEWLSNKTGQSYRLPTEAEWEFSAGNGRSHTRYSWGIDNPIGSQGGNVADESSALKFSWSRTSDNIFLNYDDGYATLAPVGSFNPNNFRLYDMTGNVWEWCMDWYGPYSFDDLPNAIGPSTGLDHVCRGSSWSSQPKSCRITYRDHLAPDGRRSNLGFRIARSATF